MHFLNLQAQLASIPPSHKPDGNFGTVVLKFVKDRNRRNVKNECFHIVSRPGLYDIALGE